MGFAVLVAEDKRGVAGALDDARGEDAKHAAMPAVAVDDEAALAVEDAVGEHGVDLGEHGLLSGAALGIQLIELVGERAGAFDVARGEELDDFGGDVHAASGVDARADAEANIAGSERATCGVELRDIKQGAQTRVDRATQAGDAKRGDDAVL